VDLGLCLAPPIQGNGGHPPGPDEGKGRGCIMVWFPERRCEKETSRMHGGLPPDLVAEELAVLV